MKMNLKRLMIMHAGLSLVLLCVPMLLMPGSGVLGGIGYWMTMVGFLLNLPGVFVQHHLKTCFPTQFIMFWMVALTEVIVFIIPKLIINMVKGKK